MVTNGVKSRWQRDFKVTMIFFSFFSFPERGREGVAKGEGEREYQPDSMPGAKPEVGLCLKTLRS